MGWFFNKKKYLYFDTHAHLNLPPLSQSASKIIKKCQSSKIRLANIAVDLKSSQLALKISKAFPKILNSCGIHPCEIKQDNYQKQLADLKQFLEKNHQKVNAIGECGLDFHHQDVPIKIQTLVFIELIKLANTYKKPLILHIRKAYQEAYEILKKYFFNKNNLLVHCFDGDIKVVEQYNKLNCFFAIGGKITYPDCKYLHDAIKNIPINRIVCETDSPFLTPLPLKKNIENTPLNLPIIIEKIKEITGDEGISKKIYANSMLFFNLKN
jgi:TatD DNase family protein